MNHRLSIPPMPWHMLVVILTALLTISTLVLGVLCVRTWAALRSPELSETLQATERQLGAVQDQLKGRQEEYAQASQLYQEWLQTLIPPRITSADMTRLLDHVVLAVGKDIQLSEVRFASSSSGDSPYRAYPVDIMILASNESLVHFVNVLRAAGDPNTLDRQFEFAGLQRTMPYMTVNKVVILGDWTDRYDASGNIIRPLVAAQIRLVLYAGG